MAGPVGSEKPEVNIDKPLSTKDSQFCLTTDHLYFMSVKSEYLDININSLSGKAT